VAVTPASHTPNHHPAREEQADGRTRAWTTSTTAEPASDSFTTRAAAPGRPRPENGMRLRGDRRQRDR